MHRVPHGINLSGNVASSESSIFTVASLKPFWSLPWGTEYPLSKGEVCGETADTPGPGGFPPAWAGFGKLCRLCEERSAFAAASLLVLHRTCTIELTSECGFGGLLLLWQDAWGDSLFAHLFDGLEYKSDPKRYRPTNIHPSDLQGSLRLKLLWQSTCLA